MEYASTSSGERILVTGASGFIGSHLVRRLIGTGAEVHAVSRNVHPDAGDRVRWWQADLAEFEEARDLLASIKPDLIFHLASHVTGSREVSLIKPTFRSNLMSTVWLLTAAHELGCGRIILTGSMEEPDLENPDAVPSSPYAVAKWAARAYARMFQVFHHLPIVILRVFMVYGPAQRDLRKLVPYVILSFLRDEPPKLTSGLRPIDWVYVEDVVEALLAAGHAPNIDGTTLDIGSGNLVPIRAVVENLVRLMAPRVQPQFGVIAERPLEQVRTAETRSTHALLDWVARTPLEEGLKRTVDWYARQFRAGQLKSSRPIGA